MRATSMFLGLAAAVAACGDDSSDSAQSDSTSLTLATTSDSAPTSTPTSGQTDSATETDDGTASDSATTSTTALPTTGQASFTGTSETGDTSTGTTDDPDTGVVDFCTPPPQGPAEDVPLNDACDIGLQTGSFNPVIEWKYGSAPYFYGPPVVGQVIDTNNSGGIDSQDLPHVFIYETGKVVALRGDGSGVAWVTAKADYGYEGSLALGDLEGDGWPEIITARYSHVCALDGRTGAEKWCADVPAGTSCPYSYNNPSIADMDGDGVAEVVLGSAVLSATGVLLGAGTLGHGGSTSGQSDLSAVVDLDADGVLEVVTGNAAYDMHGNILWQNGEVDGTVAVADFDLDGHGEIVKTYGGGIYGMESDGTHVWGPVNYGSLLGAAAIDDLDGDGTPELVVAGQNNLVALEWGGAVIWTAPVSDSSGAAGPVLFDFEKDGYPEVLYADEVAIRFFSGLDGTLKFQSMEHSSATAFETPVVVDIDGDNHVEIVLGHGGGNAQIGSVTVYGDADNSWPPGRKIWNQHSYHITNVSDLGAIPSQYQPNWLPGFNSFRSGDAGQLPGEYHDLQVEILGVCETQCEMGTFFMTARPRNAGTLEAPAGLPVTVRAGVGGDIVVTLETTQPIPAGKTGELLFFEFAAQDLAQSQPVITVDDTGVGEGKLFECDELNNTAVWPEAVCPTVEPG
ncbi:FG-GAP-like repeat-containing protein [Nannocystis sp. SCPEA4]|uniref:FG-GAP repeat domain-containing protein n=1 Tax=Nannocystis sp. SCPEA4 TaxID=2996787 RepID=UPI00226E6365|nr:FG-GAP-like repeat-containing protein [Nannocystis sp. SCPEA4]MCY1059273.1 FG-GAP-like repeat-containing protein [Nannocystis sp. SCPEA4]